MKLTEDMLDEFVRKSDELGGPGHPGCDAYWADVTYQPAYPVNQSLDPFSEAYVDEQLSLYRELSGREMDQAENELTTIDRKRHVAAPNPYDHPDPLALADHMSRLLKAFRKAGAPRNSHLLDMGCGWGLSSEVAAYLGYRVTAVDINPEFVALVNARAKRMGWPITAVQSEFDTYCPQPGTDLVMFYECLHHAVRPWTLIQTMADSLKPQTGKLLLAGEPINDYWWIHWGLRLDPMSIYCIRKFGWFESGWSRPFLEECFRRAGLSVNIDTDEHGATVVGQRIPQGDYSARAYLAATRSEGFVVEGEMAVTPGAGSFDIVFPAGASRAYIKFLCYRPKGLQLDVSADGAPVYSAVAPAEFSDVMVERGGDHMTIDVRCETWTPDEDIGNGDTRRLGIHLYSVAFY